MNSATTAERLKAIMAERNLRQVDIIRLCEPFCQQYNLKITKSDMSQFISGKVTPGQWKISILSKALNVNEAWLMGYDVSPVRNTESVNVPAAPQISPERAALLKYVDSLPESQVGSALKALQFYRSLVEDEHK